MHALESESVVNCTVSKQVGDGSWCTGAHGGLTRTGQVTSAVDNETRKGCKSDRQIESLKLNAA